MSSYTKLPAMSCFRLAVLLVFVLSAGGTLSSLAAQYLVGMNPCVMCIQQRLGLLFTALAALLCLLLPLSKTWGKTAAALLMSAPAGFGLYIAIKQIHLQSLPMHLQPSCGAPWTFRLRNWPLFDLYEPIIRGSGTCGEIYRVLGISLPVWSALFFSMILLLTWGMWFKTLKTKKI